MTWIHAIPWLIAILGWFAGHAFSEARERRKEIKGMIERIQERLAANEKLAIEFHTCANFDEAKSRQITANIDRIDRAISRIPILNGKKLEPFIISHRQSITLNNFDLSEFKQQILASALIQEITNSVLELEDEIERQYQERYPSNFPYFKWPGIKNFLTFWR